MRAGGNPKDFRSGIELIQKQLDDALRKLGLTPIVAKGEVFDPRVHEAVDVVDTNAYEDSRVIEVLQPGYILGDQLLRPAMACGKKSALNDARSGSGLRYLVLAFGCKSGMRDESLFPIISWLMISLSARSQSCRASPSGRPRSSQI
jgi:GrpE protein